MLHADVHHENRSGMIPRCPEGSRSLCQMLNSSALGNSETSVTSSNPIGNLELWVMLFLEPT
jgi:hypothetical protein